MDGQAKQEKPTSTATSTSGSNNAGENSTGKDGRGNKHAGSENKKGSDGGKIKRVSSLAFVVISGCVNGDPAGYSRMPVTRRRCAEVRSTGFIDGNSDACSTLFFDVATIQIAACDVCRLRK